MHFVEDCNPDTTTGNNKDNTQLKTKLKKNTEKCFEQTIIYFTRDFC